MRWDQGEKLGEEVVDSKGCPSAKVQGAAAQPVRPVRPTESLHAQVRDVQDLLPEACPGGRDPWYYQIELVADRYSQAVWALLRKVT